MVRRPTCITHFRRMRTVHDHAARHPGHRSQHLPSHALARSQMKYAALLGQKLQQHGTQVWLVNTGWTGGE